MSDTTIQDRLATAAQRIGSVFRSDTDGGDETDGKPPLPARYPKTPAPYIREEDDEGNYVVDPDGEFLGVRDGYEWVFERADECVAIEKLHGTNCAVHVTDHEHGGWYVNEVAARDGDKAMNKVDPYRSSRMYSQITAAVQNTVERGYLERVVDTYGKGWIFGEVVGPGLHDNRHELDEQLFVPFDWLRDKTVYKSYGKYDTSYEAIRDWFRGSDNGIFSLFASRMHDVDLQPDWPEPPSVLTCARPSAGTFIEGLIIIHPDYEGRLHPDDLGRGLDDRQIVKIRRDFFTGYHEDRPDPNKDAVDDDSPPPWPYTPRID